MSPEQAQQGKFPSIRGVCPSRGLIGRSRIRFPCLCSRASQDQRFAASRAPNSLLGEFVFGLQVLPATWTPEGNRHCCTPACCRINCPSSAITLWLFLVQLFI